MYSCSKLVLKSYKLLTTGERKICKEFTSIHSQQSVPRRKTGFLAL